MLSERTKNDLTYTECFDGREAVDKIAYIIKTTDRNLALLLGRALDAQKFFHDVTYDHRLRDSPHELYQFKGRLAASPFASRDEIVVPNERGAALLPLVEQASATGHSAPRRRASRTETVTSEEPELPCGVFTLLTDCYSPTCTRDRLCYSIACPRRLEQQARLNLKPKPGLKRAISTESLGDLKEPGTLWIHSTPQEVVDSVSDQEKKRQEAINECIYTERDFVRDLEYLRDVRSFPARATLTSREVLMLLRSTDSLGSSPYRRRTSYPKRDGKTSSPKSSGTSSTSSTSTRGSANSSASGKSRHT